MNVLPRIQTIEYTTIETVVFLNSAVSLGMNWIKLSPRNYFSVSSKKEGMG